MDKKTKKTVLGCAAAAAAVGAAAGISYQLTKYFVRLAMDREMPPTPVDMEQGKRRFVWSPKSHPFLDEVAAAGDKLRRSGCERVEIAARDGVKLIGHWHRCENAKRTIVAMHGWRSSWCNDFGLIADFWFENGCNVLFAEQRAQGGSGGEYIGFGVLERYDCLDWVNWVNGRTGSDLPVYLGGISMGASTVLMAAGLELPENVRGVAADCGFTSPEAIWKHVSENKLHLIYGLRAGIVNQLCRARLDVNAGECSTLEALKNCAVPVLFVHGTEDGFVPIEMTYENYEACPTRKRLLVVPGAEHGMSYYLAKEQYEEMVKAMWRECEG